MRNSILIIIVLIYYMILGCTTEGMRLQTQSHEKPEFTRHFDDSLFKITEKELFSVEIVTDKKDLKIDKDTIGIIIHNAHHEDVEGADIRISIRRPIQDKTELFTAAEKGDGLYIITNVSLQRNNKCELRITIKKGAMEDSAVFGFSDMPSN